ncbi:hypothetical protein SynWH8101_1437 [Synechococcus sp. WH 8101]|nr:hypothetical protein SynWH8101_1437 [Synechococcus sp. WH 8101]
MYDGCLMNINPNKRKALVINQLAENYNATGSVENGGWLWLTANPCQSDRASH